MIGCPDSDSQAKRVRDVVSMMGDPKKTFLCGQLGTGNAVKISNNYLSGTFLLAIAESMAIGIRSGVDKNVLAEVIRNSSGNSWMGEHMQPVPGILPTAPSSNHYKPGFRHALMVKDLTLGIEAGRKHGIAPTMAETAVEVSKKAAKDPRTEVSGRPDCTAPNLTESRHVTLHPCISLLPMVNKGLLKDLIAWIALTAHGRSNGA